MINTTQNPYLGLRPFSENESLLFFGRNEQTMELLERLHKHHFVAVLGSSGCGKSSLLRAGLIPALKAGYLIKNSEYWFLNIMKPGQDPLYNLAESILLQFNPAVDPPVVAKLIQQIKEQGADAIINLVAPVKTEKNTNFFLLVDQFEELFRFTLSHSDVAKKDEAIEFVNIILELAQQPVIPFFVVITLRSDFVGDCAQFFGLPEAMNQSQFLVPRLNRSQLKTVIESPAKLYGRKVDPNLTSRLINELWKVNDELPLLQHALMRMWEIDTNLKKSGVLDLENYERIGSIEKALSYHADEAIQGMSNEDFQITKQIFQALTRIDENGRKIRRPVLLSELSALTGTSAEKLLSIIDLFINDKRSFLIINNIGNGDKIIDISHESLIRQWSRLDQWVKEEAESAEMYLRLNEAAQLYKQHKKDLLAGIELTLFLNWHANFKPSPVWGNFYKTGFEDCMNYLYASEKLLRSTRDKEKTRRSRQKYLTFIIIVLLVIIVVYATVIFLRSTG